VPYFANEKRIEQKRWLQDADKKDNAKEPTVSVWQVNTVQEVRSNEFIISFTYGCPFSQDCHLYHFMCSFQKNVILNVQDIETMREFPGEHFHDLSLRFICSTQWALHWKAWSSLLPGSTCFTSRLASEAFCIDYSNNEDTFCLLLD